MNYNDNESYAITTDIRGCITSDLEYSHIQYGEKFYRTYISVKRMSGVLDNIPLIISERTAAFCDISAGIYAAVSGQVRTYNSRSDGHTRLHMFIFVIGWQIITRESCDERFIMDGMTCSTNGNDICISGYICKPAVYRTTPCGREISDLLIAVNRHYGKSDYIPCIAWGRNAGYVSQIPVGSRMEFHGRFQSRKYVKAVDNDNLEHRTAYEISINSIESVSIQNYASNDN